MAMRGWREQMEDAHLACTSLPNGLSLFAVFDGHGGKYYELQPKLSKLGKEVAKFVAKSYVEALINLQSFKQKKFKQALTEVNYKLDEKMKLEKYWKELTELAAGGSNNDMTKWQELGGCTTTVVLITPTVIYCANAGDSRTVMSEAGKAVALSFDHKPDNELETKRIVASGAQVEGGRVDGSLAVSRSLGDFEYKNNKDK